MFKEFYHHTESQLAFHQFALRFSRRLADSEFSTKPNPFSVLWLSSATGQYSHWLDYCAKERFRYNTFMYSYKFLIDMNNILVVNSESDIHRYANHSYHIDFNLIRNEGYHGIYYTGFRISNFSGWDIPSLVLWDIKSILYYDLEYQFNSTAEIYNFFESINSEVSNGN